MGKTTGGAIPVQTSGAQIVPGNGMAVAVPSGQPVVLEDVIWNVPGPNGLALRFRFLAPQIARDGGSITFDQAVADIRHLCDTYALPRLTDFGPQPTQIIISLSDRPVPFGETQPEATQFFEAFSVRDGKCEWEMF